MHIYRVYCKESQKLWDIKGKLIMYMILKELH